MSYALQLCKYTTLGDGLLYNYDQLNRIVRMNAFTGLNKADNSFIPAITTDYHEEISYDPNGNITTYLRNGTTKGGTPPGMDNLTYQYEKNASGQVLSNRLRYVHDQVPDANYPEDLNNQSSLTLAQVQAEKSALLAGDNYGYDAIGNLTKDSKEGINNIDWTVYGKIKTITKTNDTTIKYTYDATGNRISKIVTTATTGDSTYYVRDASGNVMSVYNKKGALSLNQTELHLYGSSRLGAYNVNVDMQNCSGTVNPITTFTRGNKFFELSNHLGNVLATVSDKRIQHTVNNTTVDYYTADVVTANDYYPFGSLMPGRKYNHANTIYRYGFGGQEKSNEIKGEGNSYTAEYWEYDPRIGRRWNSDPIPNISESRYATFRNNPIAYNDVNGDCPDCPNGKYQIKAKDNFSSLEKKWGMKQGTLAGYNSGVNAKKLKIGSSITVSPTSATTNDSPSQSVTLNAGTSTTTAASFKFDEDFPYDPNAKATIGDKASWTKWGIQSWGAGKVTDMDDGVEAYEHYRNGKGADKTFSFMEYKTEDASGAGTVNNVEGILRTNLPTILPYSGFRDFNISSVSSNYSSNLFKYPATENWQKAIGAYNFWVTGTVTARDVAGKLSYSVQYTIHAIDRYNFNKGMSDIKTGPSDNVNGRFSTLGWAQSFLHQGTYSGLLKFTK